MTIDELRADEKRRYAAVLGPRTVRILRGGRYEPAAFRDARGRRLLRCGLVEWELE